MQASGIIPIRALAPPNESQRACLNVSSAAKNPPSGRLPTSRRSLCVPLWPLWWRF